MDDGNANDRPAMQDDAQDDDRIRAFEDRIIGPMPTKEQEQRFFHFLRQLGAASEWIVDGLNPLRKYGTGVSFDHAVVGIEMARAWLEELEGLFYELGLTKEDQAAILRAEQEERQLRRVQRAGKLESGR